jgi:WD40 repeat protein
MPTTLLVTSSCQNNNICVGTPDGHLIRSLNVGFRGPDAVVPFLSREGALRIAYSIGNVVRILDADGTNHRSLEIDEYIGSLSWLKGTAHDWLALSGLDGLACIWDPSLEVESATSNAIMTAKPGCGVNGMCPDPYLNRIGLATTHGPLFWDPYNGTVTGSSLSNVPEAASICVLSGGRLSTSLIATTGKDGSIHVWNNDLSTTELLEGGTEGSYSIHITSIPGRDGTAILAATRPDGSVHVWLPSVGVRISSYEDIGLTTGICSFTEPNGEHLLATTGEDGIIRTWPLIGGEPIATFQWDDGPATSIHAVTV